MSVPKTPSAGKKLRQAPDVAFFRLRLAGWSNGASQFVAYGRTQREAWAIACNNADTLGMFGFPVSTPSVGLGNDDFGYQLESTLRR